MEYRRQASGPAVGLPGSRGPSAQARAAHDGL